MAKREREREQERKKEERERKSLIKGETISKTNVKITVQHLLTDTV
jgi:hypothetical protein